MDLMMIKRDSSPVWRSPPQTTSNVTLISKVISAIVLYERSKTPTHVLRHSDVMVIYIYIFNGK